MLLKVWKTFPINHIVGKWQKYFRTCNVCLLDISVVYKFRKCVQALAHNISSHGLSVFVVFIYFMVHYQACYELVWHSDLIYFQQFGSVQFQIRDSVDDMQIQNKFKIDMCHCHCIVSIHTLHTMYHLYHCTMSDKGWWILSMNSIVSFRKNF